MCRIRIATDFEADVIHSWDFARDEAIEVRQWRFEEEDEYDVGIYDSSDRSISIEFLGGEVLPGLSRDAVDVVETCGSCES